MFSVPDIAVIGVLALLLFGPDRLPGILRQAGKTMRDIQNTSQSFIAEMERAADLNEAPARAPEPAPRVAMPAPPPEEASDEAPDEAPAAAAEPPAEGA